MRPNTGNSGGAIGHCALSMSIFTYIPFVQSEGPITPGSPTPSVGFSGCNSEKSGGPTSIS